MNIVYIVEIYSSEKNRQKSTKTKKKSILEAAKSLLKK